MLAQAARPHAARRGRHVSARTGTPTARARPTRRAARSAPAPTTTRWASPGCSRSRALMKARQAARAHRRLRASGPPRSAGCSDRRPMPQNPVYPAAKTVANLTLDILQTGGPARDVMLVGNGPEQPGGRPRRRAPRRRAASSRPRRCPNAGCSTAPTISRSRATRRADAAADGDQRRARPGRRAGARRARRG